MQGTRVARGPGGTDGDDGVTRVGGDSAVVRVGDNDDAALGAGSRGPRNTWLFSQ
ncbi:hypothetical protein GCM10009859_10790 [Kocuria salsicia]